MVQLGEHFASDDRSRHSDWLRQQRWFIKARQDNQRREEITEKHEENIGALAGEVVLATQAQIKTFEAKLDTYDQATVVALMENQEQFDLVRARLADMLDRAYVLEDGRRVFKTEDGTQVFDEFGEEVGREVIAPEMINPELPTWEAYSADINLEKSLEAQREEIFEYQDKLDAAREEIDEGDISESDLEALDADLIEAMPPAVRTHVPGLTDTKPTPDLKAEFRAPAAMPEAQTQSAEGSTPTHALT